MASVTRDGDKAFGFGSTTATVIVSRSDWAGINQATARTDRAACLTSGTGQRGGEPLRERQTIRGFRRSEKTIHNKLAAVDWLNPRIERPGIVLKDYIRQRST